MSLLVADISSHNTILNWGTFLGSLDGLIVKISEGVGYTWPGAANALTQARKAGKLAGVYHFARLNDPVVEANYFLANYAHQPGEVIVLDWEPGAAPDPDGWAYAWCQRVIAVTGVVPLVYLNKYYATQQSQWPKTRSLGCQLWAAWYGIDNGQPQPGRPSFSPWPSPVLWQYTSAGTLPGSAGSLDLNQFYGTAASWRSLGSPSSGEDPSVKNLVLGQHSGDPTVWVGDGLVRRTVADETELAGLQYWIGQKGGDPKVYGIEDLRVLGVPLRDDLGYVRDQVGAWLGAADTTQAASSSAVLDGVKTLQAAQQQPTGALDAQQVADLVVAKLGQRINTPPAS